MARERLDRALEQRGLVPSRARARDAILRGTVTINGERAAKPHQLVGDADTIAIDDPASGYVSRAALKLIAGFDAAAISPAGRVCLDIGASTGGFTQVLLERGAARVYAVDVGHEQLHPSLRNHPRVVSLDGQNARDLTSAQVPEPVDLLTCDVSFVSAIKVLGPPLALCRPGAAAIVLIKPQFEAGPEHVGRGGIVRDAEAIRAAEATVTAFMASRGWRPGAAMPSPIAGGDGNRETVATWFLAELAFY